MMKHMCKSEPRFMIYVSEKALSRVSLIAMHLYGVNSEVIMPRRIMDRGFSDVLGKDIEIEIDYLNSNNGDMLLQYNSLNSWKDLGGAYEPSKAVKLNNTGKLLKAKFVIDDANFEGRQNGQSDFRLLNLSNKPLAIKKVTVHKK